ncbi:MAG: AraC family transcriptional regulator [Clostridia bacterium]|nr:AraC family transcriptional regulator [Clostridia bacterium]
MRILNKISEKIGWRIRSKRQYYLLLVSYATIILITMLVNLFGSGVAQRVLENEREKADISMIENIRSNIDANFEDAKKSASRLLSSNSVKVYQNAFNLDIVRKNDFALDIINNISNCVANSSFVEKCIVVISGKDSCFDSFGKSDTLLTYSMYFSSYYSSCEEWLNDVFSNQASRFLTLVSNTGKSTLFYIGQEPSYPQKSQTAVIIEFDTESIERYLKEISSSSGDKVYILSGNGKGLFGFNEGDASGVFEGEKGSFLHKIDKNYYMIHYTSSSVVDFKYVYSILRNSYEKTVNFVKICFVLCYLICILASGILAYAFTNANYRPLSALLRKLQKGENADNIDSEYQYIWNFIEELEKNKKEIEKKSDKQQRELKKNVISQILLGGIRLTDTKSEVLRANEINFFDKYFLVAVFDVQEAGAIGDEITDDNLAMVQFLIKNVFSELLEGVAVTNYCEINELCACVISFRENSGYENIINKAVYTSNFLNKKLKIRFKGAFSQVTDDISKLPELYEQAYEVSNFCLLDNDKYIFTYDELLCGSRRYEYSMETQRLITHMLISGDENGVIKIIENVFKKNLGELKINASMFRLLVVEMTGTLIKNLTEKNDMTISENNSLWTMFAYGFKNVNPNEVKAEIIKCAKEICSANNQNNLELKNYRLEEIKEFIHKNYSDPDMSVSMIAEMFHVSLYHISRSFKNEIGEGMAEYILGYRIEKSKELLKNTDEPINKIAVKVGFEVTSSFNRTFKKHVGITPKQYREYESTGDKK